MSKSRNRTQKTASLLLLGFALLLFDYPYLLHATDSVYGFPVGDYASSLWDFWVNRRALLLHQSPFLTDALFQGHPASLVYHTLNLFYFLTSAPVYLATKNVFLAFNLSQLFADTLGLMFFYRLARAVGASRLLAVLGATCFTFCAYKLQRWPPLNLQSTWLLSFYAFALIRLWKSPRSRNAILLGIAAAALIIEDWHCLIFSGLATPFLLAWLKTSFDIPVVDRPRLRAFLIASLVALPFFAFYFVLAQRHAPMVDYAPHDVMVRTLWSASPIYYVMPGWLESSWLDWIAPYAAPHLIFQYKTHGEWSLFLGVIPIALAILALRSGARFRRDWPLVVAAFLFFTISLGPYLILIRPVTLPNGWLFPMPALYLFKLPIFEVIKHVSRFGGMVLFLVLLLAMSRATFAPRVRRIWISVALALILLHRVDMQWFVPAKTIYCPSDSLRAALTDGKAPGFAMTLPVDWWESEAVGLYLQTIHERTSFDGYVSRMPKDAATRRNVHLFFKAMKSVQESGGSLPLPEIPAKDQPALVNLVKKFVRPDQAQALAAALQTYGYRMAYEDQNVAVFHK